MGSHNLLFANLQPSSQADHRPLDLYRLLHDFSKLPTAFYRSPNNRQSVQTLHNLIGGCKFNTTASGAVQDANVFVFNADHEVLSLGRSNRIIIFVPGELTDNILPLLPVADVIATYSIYEAATISKQLRRLGYQTPVAKVVPPFDIRRYHPVPQATLRVGYQTSIDKELLTALADSAVEFIPSNGQFNNVAAYVHIQTPVWPFDVIESLICGKPVVTPKRPPLLEYVVENFNGFLTRDKYEILAAIERLKNENTRFRFGAQARDFITGQLDPETYVAEILNLLTDKFYNLNVKHIPDYNDHDKRKWLFRKQVLSQNGALFVPEYYDPSFAISNLSTVQEILSFLLQQQFNCAYIFEFELGDPNNLEFNIISGMAERLGRRGLSVHFCTDDPIPDRWRDVFKNLSIVSVSEGIKQVS